MHGKILSLDPFVLSSFLIFAIFGNALDYSLFYELETYHQLAGEIVFTPINFFLENIIFC